MRAAGCLAPAIVPRDLTETSGLSRANCKHGRGQDWGAAPYRGAGKLDFRNDLGYTVAQGDLP